MNAETICSVVDSLHSKKARLAMMHHIRDFAFAPGQFCSGHSSGNNAAHLSLNTVNSQRLLPPTV